MLAGFEVLRVALLPTAVPTGRLPVATDAVPEEDTGLPPAMVVAVLTPCCLSRIVVVPVRTAVVLPVVAVLPVEMLFPAAGATLVLPEVLAPETVVRLWLEDEDAATVVFLPVLLLLPKPPRSDELPFANTLSEPV